MTDNESIIELAERTTSAATAYGVQHAAVSLTCYSHTNVWTARLSGRLPRHPFHVVSLVKCEGQEARAALYKLWLDTLERCEKEWSKSL